MDAIEASIEALEASKAAMKALTEEIGKAAQNAKSALGDEAPKSVELEQFQEVSRLLTKSLFSLAVMDLEKKLLPVYIKRSNAEFTLSFDSKNTEANLAQTESQEEITRALDDFKSEPQADALSREEQLTLDKWIDFGTRFGLSATETVTRLHDDILRAGDPVSETTIQSQSGGTDREPETASQSPPDETVQVVKAPSKKAAKPPPNPTYDKYNIYSIDDNAFDELVANASIMKKRCQILYLPVKPKQNRITKIDGLAEKGTLLTFAEAKAEVDKFDGASQPQLEYVLKVAISLRNKKNGLQDLDWVYVSRIVANRLQIPQDEKGDFRLPNKTPFILQKVCALLAFQDDSPFLPANTTFPESFDTKGTKIDLRQRGAKYLRYFFSEDRDADGDSSPLSRFDEWNAKVLQPKSTEKKSNQRSKQAFVETSSTPSEPTDTEGGGTLSDFDERVEVDGRYTSFRQTVGVV